MLRLASDADVHGDIIRGLWRRRPGIDLLRSQDSLPLGAPDVDVMSWAAAAGRVLITNDRNTMIGLAYQRVAAGGRFSGLIITSKEQSIGAAIDDILFLADCMSAEEVGGQIAIFLPFQG
jgi:Domain of unknown function (DUF5615)